MPARTSCAAASTIHASTSASQKGIVRYSTEAEATAGTHNDSAVTPEGLQSVLVAGESHGIGTYAILYYSGNDQGNLTPGTLVSGSDLIWLDDFRTDRHLVRFQGGDGANLLSDGMWRLMGSGVQMSVPQNPGQTNTHYHMSAGLYLRVS